MSHRAVTFGPVCITTGWQGQGAPIVDKAISCAADGRRFEGRAVLLKPWKRGERSIRARFLFIGLHRGAWR